MVLRRHRVRVCAAHATIVELTMFMVTKRIIFIVVSCLLRELADQGVSNT
jgi:hypothetical protein